MTAKPHVWHYGLVAQWWAEFNVDAPELPYYQEQIERHGEPVLDLACGTGRLLLPLLRAGIDVDGCDISPDMLRLCQEKVAHEALAPRLYQQAMHELDLPRTYKTIYICDSFGLAGGRELDQAALRQCYAHLDAGGALVFNLEAGYASPGAWQYWTPAKRRELPSPWPEQGDRRRASDGSDLVLRYRLLDLDPLEQSYLHQMRAERWQDGDLIAEEEYTLREQMYFKNEVVMMLERAGFQDISVQGDYTEESATPDHSELIYIARK